jgi:Cu/Ag efflux pump CusA
MVVRFMLVIIRRFPAFFRYASSTMNFQKALPVVTSICIILIVAALRERSRTAAAIFASMPINIPLALWVVFGNQIPVDVPAESLFLRNIGIGLLTTLVWVGVVYVALQYGLGLLPAVVVGYVVWGALTALWFAVGVMKIG